MRVLVEDPRTDVVELLHGREVRDPYRWLEEDTPETRRWIERQQRMTRRHLAALDSRPHLERRLEELMDYPRYGVPQRRRGRWVYTRNDGLQNQPIVFTSRGWSDSPRVLVNPNELADDGTRSLTGFELSPDGRLLAYGTSDGGSDWQEWRVRDVATGRDLPDVVRRVKFSAAAWMHDGSGYFYSRFDQPSNAAERAHRGMKVYFHRLGTDQAEDPVVYWNPSRPDRGYIAEVTDDGRYLVLQVWSGDSQHRGLLVCDLTETPVPRDADGHLLPMRELPGAFRARWNLVTNEGSRLLLETDLDAPRGRVLAVDLERLDEMPHPELWPEVVPQGDATLEAVTRAGDQLFVRTLRSAATAIQRYRLDGTPLGELPLPYTATATELSGGRDERDVFFVLTSFVTPPTLYRYSLDDGDCRPVHDASPAFSPDDFVTRQYGLLSRDGTRLTVFLSHRRDVTPGPDTPTLLYGYGGFNVAVTPQFSAGNLLFMEMGGVFAAANIRGGGEYGEGWHRAGTRRTKQRTFDDFQAVAEWLGAEGLSDPERIAIIGSSNGGLLVGACLTQRPDLYAAAVVRMGVLDMLRFHRFTIGWAWVSDYGSPDDPEEFRVLAGYSPYHNVRPGTRYPPTLVATADHDDRVVPLHSFKFTAALQAAQGADAPVLLRVDTRAGHGAGTSVRKRIEQATDELAFVADALGMEAPVDRPVALASPLNTGEASSEPPRAPDVWPRRHE